MFTLRVTVPHITRTHISQFEAMIPGFFAVATVPVIETEEQAIRAAKVIGDKKMASREFISNKDTKVTKTNTGWDIEFLCYGD
jgi:hypothetical protein